MSFISLEMVFRFIIKRYVLFLDHINYKWVINFAYEDNFKSFQSHKTSVGEPEPGPGIGPFYRKQEPVKVIYKKIWELEPVNPLKIGSQEPGVSPFYREPVKENYKNGSSSREPGLF